MNTRKTALISLAVLTIFIMFSSHTFATAQVMGDDVGEYEENKFLGGLDIWVNQTQSSPTMSPNMDTQEQSWELVHYVLLPNSVNLDNWVIFDDSAKFRFGLFGGQITDEPTGENGITKVSAKEKKSGTGLSGVGGRDVDTITNKDANREVAKTEATTYDMTYDFLNNTPNTDNWKNNYTAPENELAQGDYYQGYEGKSINDYGKDIANGVGADFNEIHNASLIGYAYDNFEKLENVVWFFDEESSNSPTPTSAFGESILKRGRTFFKSDRRDDDGGIGEKFSNSLTDLNVFKDVSLGSSDNLVGMPFDATKFFSKALDGGLPDMPNLFKNPLGLGSVFDAGKKVLKAVGIILIIGTLGFVGLMIYRQRQMN